MGLKYLSFLGGSLITQGILSLFLPSELIISLFLVMAGVWMTLESRKQKEHKR